MRGINAVLSGDKPVAVEPRIGRDAMTTVASLAGPVAGSVTNLTATILSDTSVQLTAFTIGDDGSLSDRRVFAATGEAPPDGISIDASGGRLEA